MGSLGWSPTVSVLTPTLPSRWAIFESWCRNMVANQVLKSPETAFRFEIVEHLIDDSEAPLPVKRNALVRQAQGDCIAWFDDDDWHHEMRLLRALEVQRHDRCDVSVSAGRYHYNLKTGEGLVLRGREQKPAAITIVMPRKLALHHTFDSRLLRGSDIEWAERVLANEKWGFSRARADFVALYHEANMTTPMLRRWRWGNAPGLVESRFTYQDVFGLEALRTALYGDHFVDGVPLSSRMLAEMSRNRTEPRFRERCAR